MAFHPLRLGAVCVYHQNLFGGFARVREKYDKVAGLWADVNERIKQNRMEQEEQG